MCGMVNRMQYLRNIFIKALHVSIHNSRYFNGYCNEFIVVPCSYCFCRTFNLSLFAVNMLSKVMLMFQFTVYKISTVETWNKRRHVNYRNGNRTRDYELA